MASGPSIVAKFLADTSQMTSGVDSATSSMSGALNSFATKAAVAIAGAFAVDKIVDFAKGGVDAAINAEQSAARLALTLKNVTGATKEQVAANEDFLAGLSKATNVSKGELRPAMDNLVRGFENAGDAQKALALATDISAGTGKDLTAVSLALMKAGDGSTLALRQLGIAVKGVDGKARPLNDIMAELGETFQGQAAAKAETAGGKLEAVGLQFSKFQTQIGAALLPAVAAVGSFLGDTVLPAIASIVGPLAASLGSFVSGTIVPAFQSLAAIVGPIINQIASFISGNLTPVFATLAATVGPVIDQIGQGLQAFVAAFVSGSDDVTSSGIAGFFENLGVVARNVFDWLIEHGPTLLVAFSPLSAIIAAVIANFDKIKEAASSVAEWFTGRLVPAVSAFADQAGPILEKVANFIANTLAPAIGDKLVPILTTLGTVAGTALGKVGEILTDTLLPAMTSVLTWINENGDTTVQILEAIGVALIAAFGPMAVAALVTFIASAVTGFISWAVAAGAAAIATLAAAAPFILIGAAIAAVAFVIIHNWDTISSVVTTVFGAIVGVVQGVISWITDNWPTLLAIITGPIGLAVLLITNNWETIKSGVTSVWQWIVDKWNAIRDAIGTAIDAIGGFITTLVDVFFKRPIAAAQELFAAISGKFTELRDFISNIIGSIGDAIGRLVDAMKAPINSFLRAFNSMVFRIPEIHVPEVDVPLVGKVGGGTFGGFEIPFPRLPLLAGGAVLSRPTMFIGGEAGTEIVAPEDLLRAIVGEEARGNYTLNLYPRTADANDVAYGFQRLELLAGLA